MSDHEDEPDERAKKIMEDAKQRESQTRKAASVLKKFFRRHFAFRRSRHNGGYSSHSP
jgi:hypothetical protein